MAVTSLPEVTVGIHGSVLSPLPAATSITAESAAIATGQGGVVTAKPIAIAGSRRDLSTIKDGIEDESGNCTSTVGGCIRDHIYWLMVTPPFQAREASAVTRSGHAAGLRVAVVVAFIVLDRITITSPIADSGGIVGIFRPFSGRNYDTIAIILAYGATSEIMGVTGVGTVFGLRSEGNLDFISISRYLVVQQRTVVARRIVCAVGYGLATITGLVIENPRSIPIAISNLIVDAKGLDLGPSYFDSHNFIVIVAINSFLGLRVTTVAIEVDFANKILAVVGLELAESPI